MIGRIAALVGLTIAYWVCALAILGVLIMGDCFENQACRDTKERVFDIGAIVVVGLYLVVMVAVGWALFRRPSD